MADQPRGTGPEDASAPGDGSGDEATTTVAKLASRGEAMPPWVLRAIFWFFGTGVALLICWWLVLRLRGLLVMLLVALFISFALEPAVNWLAERGWRRGTATLTVMVVLLVGVGLFIWAMGSVLVNQVTDFVDEAPRYIEDAEAWFNDTFDADVKADDLTQEFQQGGSAQEFAANLAGNIVAVGATVVRVLFQLLTIALFTFYLVADGPRLRRAILSVLPKEKQAEVLRVWEIAIEKTGGYIYSRAVLAFFSTVFHWVAFAVIGIPFPLPLALWVGLISQFVPTIGTYIAGFLPVAIALIDKPIDAPVGPGRDRALPADRELPAGPTDPGRDDGHPPRCRLRRGDRGGQHPGPDRRAPRPACGGHAAGLRLHLRAAPRGHRQPPHPTAAGPGRRPAAAAVPAADPGRRGGPGRPRGRG